MVAVIRRWLLVSINGDVQVRVRKPKYETIRWDQIAVPLDIRIPDGWGDLEDHPLSLDMPEPMGLRLLISESKAGAASTEPPPDGPPDR